MSGPDLGMQERIPLEGMAKDFAAIAQNALVNATYLPGGYLTPPLNYRIEGTDLVRSRKDDGR